MDRDWDSYYRSFGVNLEDLRQQELRNILQTHGEVPEPKATVHKLHVAVERLYGRLLQDANQFPEDYLHPGFDLSTYNKSALRMVLTMHGIPYPESPRVDMLRALFASHLGTMRAVRNYVSPLPMKEEANLSDMMGGLKVGGNHFLEAKAEKKRKKKKAPAFSYGNTHPQQVLGQAGQQYPPQLTTYSPSGSYVQYPGINSGHPAASHPGVNTTLHPPPSTTRRTSPASDQNQQNTERSSHAFGQHSSTSHPSQTFSQQGFPLQSMFSPPASSQQTRWNSTQQTSFQPALQYGQQDYQPQQPPTGSQGLPPNQASFLNQTAAHPTYSFEHSQDSVSRRAQKQQALSQLEDGIESRYQKALKALAKNDKKKAQKYIEATHANFREVANILCDGSSSDESDSDSDDEFADQ